MVLKPTKKVESDKGWKEEVEPLVRRGVGK